MKIADTVLSGYYPKGGLLRLILLAIFIGLLFAPFIFPGFRALQVAGTICIFIVLVASFDLMLGYTGVVSFAHNMFFGIGAYAVAIGLTYYGNTWGVLFVFSLIGVLVAFVLAVLIGLFSLRVRALFFAMVTLAVASAFLILASQLSGLTGGEDGLSFSVPYELTPAFRPLKDKFLGVSINGRLFTYYLIFFSSSGLFLFMLRLVNSPYGRVLQAVRENEFRAEALGYRTVYYRTLITGLSASIASLAGVLMALLLRYNGPETTLSFDIMIDILLMLVIGGMGTLYGAAIGAVLFVLAKNYLRDIMGQVSSATADLPFLPDITNPDRWLLWLGLLFILSVYFFPTGIVGKLKGIKDG